MFARILSDVAAGSDVNKNNTVRSLHLSSPVVKIIVRQHRKFVMRNPISDAHFCDDLSYIPRQYIKGTIHLPARQQTFPTSS